MFIYFILFYSFILFILTPRSQVMLNRKTKTYQIMCSEKYIPFCFLAWIYKNN